MAEFLRPEVDTTRLRRSRNLTQLLTVGRLWKETIMSDDKNNRGPQDRSRISLSEDYEVRYWTDALGVTQDRLREIVGRVGNSAEAVREALKK